MTTGTLTRKSLLGSDRPMDLVLVIGLFVFYSLMDLGTRLISRVNNFRLDDPFLLVSSLLSNRVAYAIAVVVLAFIAWRWPRRLWSPWSWLEHGDILRKFALVLVLFLLWQGAFYEFNFLLGTWHVADRILLAALAVGAWYRPVFLGGFVLQFRVIAGQFDYPFNTTAAQNVNELLVIAVLAVAAAHLLFVTTGQRRTAPVLMILSAAVATHFFIPGRAKIGMDWLAASNLSNLPLSGYTKGWLANGDGSFYRSVESFISPIEGGLMLGTLAVELGSAIAAMHYKLMRVWLPAAILFHIGVFISTGFWFISWILLEVMLIVIFFMPSLRSWAQENLTLPRALITLGAIVIAGGFLFHPPRLAWLDLPNTSGYRIEAIGESGQRYNVPTALFSPVVQEIRFLRLTDPGDNEFESEAGEAAALTDGGERFLASFLSHTNERAAGGGATPVSRLLPDPFWMQVPDPAYQWDEPLEQIDLFILEAMNTSAGAEFEKKLVGSVSK